MPRSGSGRWLRMSERQGQVFSGTLVLIAPKGASASQCEDMCAKAQAAHKSTVIVLPHGWKATDSAGLKKMLADLERKPEVKIGEPQSIGTSKPPPPPPPPP